MNPIRPLNAAVKAEVAADYNALMYARIVQQNDEAHVFTTALADLESWWLALGGSITREEAGPGVVLYTLHTTTDHGTGAPVRVHALALDTDQLDADIAPHVA